ncbi:peptidylprolyl isomerase [Pedomonas mirosovicensis]|uniref:peptidylprolyl isomerase n=1 Tax=Pedomonas mirosovicensis TaxID=2908641 RepID=UPI00286EBD1D|nr:peptidylprolyl isomerase [Pedomonas mirosovicensis]
MAQTETTVAPAATDLENVLVIELSTGGTVKIAMRPDKAPKHVERIKQLAREGFYDGTIFHRVIEGFMAQGGDPTGTGMGGSKYPNLPAEFNDLPHVRGTASMARAGDPNSANSQFFICFQPAFFLDGQYTVWGRVIEGMEAVDGIARGEPPANPTKIVKAYVAADAAKAEGEGAAQ